MVLVWFVRLQLGGMGTSTPKVLAKFEVVGAPKNREALDQIPPASPNMDFQVLACRLELKIYFELESDVLFYKIDAFKMYLSRSRQKILPENTYEVNVNFVNILNQMFQSKPGDSRPNETIYKRKGGKNRCTKKIG